MKHTDATIRRAHKEDAPVLARLINFAGEGIPLWIWRQSAASDEEAFAVGAQRAARDSGGFSYSNAHVAEFDGQVAAMLLGYRLPDPYDTGDLNEVPDVVRPLIELESRAAGSWYLNAIASFEHYRGRGIGSSLMSLALELARKSGATTLSLIVAQENQGAFRLYQREGYTALASRPVIPFPGCAFSGDWVLMTRPVT
ncbi:MAG: GNAT family N-acetyltransferase [Betaproteobacteria bacterium]|nr:MAG: GNAT family N-acetyltransferase [Betaproteobacteria bacterium]